MPKVLSRKKRDPMLEKRTVPMLIGESREEVHIHEELLSLNSPYFRRKLQPKRKSLEDKKDRECPICHEPMELDQDSIKVCERQCGKTFHSICIDPWLKDNSTCPHCRAPWLVPKPRTQAISLPRLSEDGMGVYREWLYHKRICIPEFESKEDGSMHPKMDVWLNAYFTGVKAEDNKFCQALYQAQVQICKECSQYSSSVIVQEAYSGSKDGAPIRAFMVGLYTQLPRHEVTEKPGLAREPAEFLVALLKAGLDVNGKLPQDWDLEEVQRKICPDIDHINPPAS